MTRTTFSLLSLLAAVSITGDAAAQRAPAHPLRAAEKALGTDGSIDWGFHRVVEDPHGLGLKFPGYLIGVEKSDRDIIGVVDTGAAARVRIDRAPAGSNVEQRRLLRRVLNDGKRTFVSHVVEYEWRGEPVPHLRPAFLHNAYARTAAAARHMNWEHAGARGEYPFFNPGSTLYDDSFEALDKLGRSLQQRLEAARAAGAPVSHVFVASMGWNTDEDEALRNYNSIFGNLFEAERAHPGRVLTAPVVIGFSWPSRWAVGGISYPTKADDADEVGVVWGNYLLQRVLLPLKERYGFRVVVLGHSFGARLTTRAVFSAPVLGVTKPREKVDLVVGLQGAFSANRFLAERAVGQEGAPYAGYRAAARQVVLTWSPYDKANPLAEYGWSANNVGGRPGYERSREYPAHFQWKRWSPGEGWLPGAEERDGKILMVDASDLVRYRTYQKGGGAHSDIYHPAMGRFLLDLVRAYAP
ncbi:MAG TPA: hypothetical protein VE913_21625 [Longimicrobium sp.]|nr:hypothetical protein [Longimicrobium sp.]